MIMRRVESVLKAGPQTANLETWSMHPQIGGGSEREFFLDNLLVRIHLIIETILVDQP